MSRCCFNFHLYSLLRIHFLSQEIIPIVYIHLLCVICNRNSDIEKTKSIYDTMAQTKLCEDMMLRVFFEFIHFDNIALNQSQTIRGVMVHD